MSLYFTIGRPFSPENCPFTWGDLDPHLIHDSLGPFETTSQTATRSVHPLLPGSRSWQTDRPSYSVAIGHICVVLRCCPIRKVVKVIWHKTASPPQMDGLIILSRWRQCAFAYGHIGATWWIRWNLCFLQPTRVHNPNGKSIGSAILAHVTAGGSSFPQNCSLPCGDLNRHLIHVSLGPPKSSVQMVRPFLQGLLVWQTDQLTDHATRSVTIDRIYVHSMGDVA